MPADAIDPVSAVQAALVTHLQAAVDAWAADRFGSAPGDVAVLPAWPGDKKAPKPPFVVVLKGRPTTRRQPPEVLSTTERDDGQLDVLWVRATWTAPIHVVGWGKSDDQRNELAQVLAEALDGEDAASLRLTTPGHFDADAYLRADVPDVGDTDRVWGGDHRVDIECEASGKRLRLTTTRKLSEAILDSEVDTDVDTTSLP